MRDKVSIRRIGHRNDRSSAAILPAQPHMVRLVEIQRDHKGFLWPWFWIDAVDMYGRDFGKSLDQ